MAIAKIYIKHPNYSLTLKKHANYSLTLNKQRATLRLARGSQGPQGIPGPAGGATVIYPAGENLSAGRVVIIDGGEAFYFQPSDPAHSGRAFGVTVGSATVGNNVTIQTIGEATDASFSAFADVPLYIGDDGELQTTWPTGPALLQKAGFGTGTNKIKIDFSIQAQQIN